MKKLGIWDYTLNYFAGEKISERDRFEFCAKTIFANTQKSTMSPLVQKMENGLKSCGIKFKIWKMAMSLKSVTFWDFLTFN